MKTKSTEKAIKGLLKTEVKETWEYKRLTSRKFKSSKNYLDYKEFALQVSSHLWSIEHCTVFDKQRDATYVGCSHAFYHAFKNNNFGVYAVDENLMQDFVETDAPKEIWGLPRPFKRALFMLPEGSIKTPDDLSLDWVLIEFLNVEDYPREVEETANYFAEKLGVERSEEAESYINTPLLRWSSIVDFQYLYSATIPVPLEQEDNPL